MNVSCHRLSNVVSKELVRDIVGISIEADCQIGLPNSSIINWWRVCISCAKQHLRYQKLAYEAYMHACTACRVDHRATAQTPERSGDDYDWLTTICQVKCAVAPCHTMAKDSRSVAGETARTCESQIVRRRLSRGDAQQT